MQAEGVREGGLRDPAKGLEVRGGQAGEVEGGEGGEGEAGLAEEDEGLPLLPAGAGGGGLLRVGVEFGVEGGLLEPSRFPLLHPLPLPQLVLESRLLVLPQQRLDLLPLVLAADCRPRWRRLALLPVALVEAGDAVEGAEDELAVGAAEAVLGEGGDVQHCVLELCMRGRGTVGLGGLRGGELQVAVLGGLDDLGDDIALDRFHREAVIGDEFVHLAQAHAQLGVEAVLDLVVGPAWRERYLRSRWAI